MKPVLVKVGRLNGVLKEMIVSEGTQIETVLTSAGFGVMSTEDIHKHGLGVVNSHYGVSEGDVFVIEPKHVDQLVTRLANKLNDEFDSSLDPRYDNADKDFIDEIIQMVKEG